MMQRKFNPTLPIRTGSRRSAGFGLVELMVSVWPTVTARSRHFEEMNERGLFIGTERGLETVQAFTDVPVFPGRADLFYYDATNPEARAFVWDRLRANYHALGIRVFWLDACEPEMWFYHFDHLRFAFGFLDLPVFGDAAVDHADAAVVLQRILGGDVAGAIVLGPHRQAGDFVPQAEVAAQIDVGNGDGVGGSGHGGLHRWKWKKRHWSNPPARVP